MLSVDLEGVGVDFPIYGAESRSLKKRLLGRRIGSRVSYGTRHVVTIHALHDVTLRIRRGERVGLTGPNGVGKSTLLRTMAGIYEPARGRVRVAGRVTTMFGLSLGLESDATGAISRMVATGTRLRTRGNRVVHQSDSVPPHVADHSSPPSDQW